MKRIISVLLILILSLGVLSACQPKQTESAYDLDAAVDYVRGLYADLLDNNKTSKDFNLIAALALQGAKFTIEWSVNSDLIKVVPSADGTEVTIDVPDTVEADLNYKLTGKVVSPDDFSKTLEFDLVVPKPAEKPILNLMGKENLVSGSGDQNVFAANGITFTNDKASSSSALTVQDSYAQRAYAGSTIKIEYKGMRKIVITCDDYEGNGKLYYTGMDGMKVDGATIIREGAVITILFLDGPVDVFQSTALAGQMRIEQIEVFTSLTAEDIANGNNQGSTDTTKYELPKEGTAYKYYINHLGLNKLLFFNGAMDQGKYLATTEDYTASPDVFFEKVEGGYHIYFMNNGVKTYINAEPYEKDKANKYLGSHFQLVDTPTCVWIFDTNYGVIKMVGEIEGYQTETFFAGTYGNEYLTFSLSRESFITGADSTQYVGRFVLSSEAGNLTAGNQGGNQGGTDSGNQDGNQDVTIDGELTTTLAPNLVFTDLANKTSGDEYMNTNFPTWTITGSLGAGYGGYLGFGRSNTEANITADKNSAITSPAFSTTSKFSVKAVIKGNGSNNVMTSTLTFTLVDTSGNVIATGYANDATEAAIIPVHGVDTTYVINFTFVEGKTWSDATNLVVTFAKVTGNIGLKSLEFYQ